MSEKNNLHNGHRDRVRERFLTDGFESFNEHQILEMLLFYAVPRRDTNELAHILINQCGSFSAVFDAPIDVLQDCGLSRNAAVLLKMLPQVFVSYTNDKFFSEKKIITTDNVADRILPNFIAADNEQVLLLLVDAKGKELFCGIISKGSVNASEIYTKKIIQLSVKYNAVGAVLAHNHPSGLPFPSSTDIKTTISLKQSLLTIGVHLIDHIIVADNDYTSMALLDEFKSIFK